jgi:hypothetical protein
MKTLYCLICGKACEAMDCTDGIICDDCPLPYTGDLNERESEKDAVQASDPNDTVQPS